MRVVGPPTGIEGVGVRDIPRAAVAIRSGSPLFRSMRLCGPPVGTGEFRTVGMLRCTSGIGVEGMRLCPAIPETGACMTGWFIERMGTVCIIGTGEAGTPAGCM
jgi:hypothetical protein